MHPQFFFPKTFWHGGVKIDDHDEGLTGNTTALATAVTEDKYANGKPPITEVARFIRKDPRMVPILLPALELPQSIHSGTAIQVRGESESSWSTTPSWRS
jgi:hypothetical protein